MIDHCMAGHNMVCEGRDASIRNHMDDVMLEDLKVERKLSIRNLKHARNWFAVLTTAAKF